MPDSGTNAAKFLFASTLMVDGAPARQPLGEATVNQSIAPTGATFGGRPWQSVETLEVPSSGIIHVRLQDLASGGVVAADGVRLVRVNPTGANLIYLSARANPLTNRAFTAVIPTLSSRAGAQIIYDNNIAPTIAQQPHLGSFGQAFRFDGNDYARTGDLKTFFSNAATRPETIEFWFNAETAGVLVSEIGQVTPTTGFNMSLIEILGSGELRARVDGATGSITAGTVSFGTWHHVAVTYQDTGIASLKIVTTYLDGVQQASAFANFPRPQDSGLVLHYALAAGVQVGLSGAATQAYKGMIDEFRVWRVARPANEISADFMRRLPSGDSNMVTFFRFDNAVAGTAIIDSSPFNLAGSPGGGTAAPSVATGIDLPNFALTLRIGTPIANAINIRDLNNDALALSASSSNPNVTVQIVGNRLLIDSAPNFIGVATITLNATDANGTPHDHRNRSATMSFDVSIRGDSIYGTRYWDRNGNNVMDGVERGVDGHQIFVDANGNGTFDKGEVTAYTDINGEYALRDIRLRSSPGGKAVVTALDATDPLGGMTPTATSELAPFDHIDNITRTDITVFIDLTQDQLFYTNRYSGSINLTPEMMSGARTLGDLAAIINSRLNPIFGGRVAAQASGAGIRFIAGAGSFGGDLYVRVFTHVFTTRTTYFADGSFSTVVTQNFNQLGGLGLPYESFTSIGFSGTMVIQGGSAAVDGGARVVTTTELPPFARRDTTTTSTVNIKLTVDGTLLGSISLNSAFVAGNASLDDLLADIMQKLTEAGFSSQVIAVLEGDRLQFQTVGAGAGKTLVVEVTQRFVSIRTTTRLDGTTFNETTADFTVQGGLGFAGRATATGNDQPQSNLDVYGVPRSDWIPVVAGDHLTPAVRGPGEVLFLNFNGRQAVARNVTEAFIVNTGWPTQFAANLAANDLNKVTFVAPGTTAPVLSLPWVGLNRLVIALPSVVAEAIRTSGVASFASALTVSGMKAGNVAFAASFDPSTGSVVLNFTGGLATDFYTVTMPGSASAGLGITGRGDAVVQFAVQPGDINGDGRTNDLDYFAAWRNNQNGEGSFRGDLNADGLWNIADIDIVRANYQKINPGAPAPTGKKGGALAPWLSIAPLASLAFSTDQSDSDEDVLNSNTAESLVVSAPDLSVTAKVELSSDQQ
jgi:hypothetical protein